MFGEQGEVAKQPRDFCIGRITSVGNLRDGRNPINKVIDVTIDPIFSSRKRDGGEKFYITFREAWLNAGHTKSDCSKEGWEDGLHDKLFGIKGSKKQPGHIHELLGQQYAELGELVQGKGSLTAAEFTDFLNDRLTNKVIGFTLVQAEEKSDEVNPETGKKDRFLTEFKNVDGFFGPEQVEGLEKSFERAKNRAEKEADKTGERTFPSMRILWEPGLNPFEAAVESLQAV